MAFNFSAGVSMMGSAIADSALDFQKAAAQKEMMVLADQMAGVRDEKQRTFQSSERVETQKHTASENALNRVTQIEAANIGLKGSLASSGASLQSARIHADSVAKQIAADNDRAVILQPNADMTVSRINKVTGRTELVLGEDKKPIKVRDPDLAKAQYEAVRAVENDKKEIRLKYQTDLSLAQSELNKLLAQPMAMQDETLKRPIAQQRKLLDEITRKRDDELKPHEERSRRLIESLSRNVDTGTNLDPNNYMPKATNPPLMSGPL